MTDSVRDAGGFLLSENGHEKGTDVSWVRPFLAIGSLASRYSKRDNDRQLVVVISVPKRDFVAPLIGTGWVLASRAPKMTEPLDLLREMEFGQPLRAVNSGHVLVGRFQSLDEEVEPPRARFADSTWRVDSIRALSLLSDSIDAARREIRPEPGSIEHMAGLEKDWDERLAQPEADLAIVGTVKWLEQDLDAFLRRAGDKRNASKLSTLVKPRTEKSATWFTRLYSSAHLADNLPLPTDLRATILDGNGAIRYLAEIETPVVFCVLDRSVADETAAEMLIQFRNTKGEPFSLSTSLRWNAPVGVEAFAFTAAL